MGDVCNLSDGLSVSFSPFVERVIHLYSYLLTRLYCLCSTRTLSPFSTCCICHRANEFEQPVTRTETRAISGLWYTWCPVRAAASRRLMATPGLWLEWRNLALDAFPTASTSSSPLWFPSHPAQKRWASLIWPHYPEDAPHPSTEGSDTTSLSTQGLARPAIMITIKP
jgi:hypothetical protein